MAGPRPRRAGRLAAAARLAPGALALTAAVAVARAPRWLPRRVVALRMWLFARINGDEAVTIPGPQVDASRFTAVYGHPAADGRSRGAALSDLFWYWLSPGPEVHQEHLEPGPRYDEVARTTRRILAIPPARVEQLATRYTAEALAHLPAGVSRVRLRDLAMPIWAGFFTEVVFGRPCPPATRALVVANADDVVTALKCCRLRHMDRRHRLTRFLLDHLDEVPHHLPTGLARRERALYLQGTFFNTAVVQMSEATAHLLLVLAQHPDLQDELAAHLAARPGGVRRRLDHVMDETLRLYPLFGIAHRITSDDIVVDERTTLPAGSVLCFDYPAFHAAGVDDPERFDPSRWEGRSRRDANHIPYGVAANRPCPARHLAPVALRAATLEVLRRATLHSSAGHTRSLPSRGPCLVVPRARVGPGPAGAHASPGSGASPGSPPPAPSGPAGLAGSADPARSAGSTRRRLAARLGVMRLLDRWEDVGRSLVQLVLGTYMVWDARRQRLCTRWFAAAGGATGTAPAASTTPSSASASSAASTIPAVTPPSRAAGGMLKGHGRRAGGAGSHRA
jgi:hypothetical protein